MAFGFAARKEIDEDTVAFEMKFYHLSTLRLLFCLLLATGSICAAPVSLPLIKEVEFQPLAAQIQRLGFAMEEMGSPFDDKTSEDLHAAMAETNPEQGIKKIQQILDAFCLFNVQINPESRVKVSPGPAKPELAEAGWRHFLVKVQNDAGVTSHLQIRSPNADRVAGSTKAELANRWLDLMTLDSQPMQANLSGLKLEYRIVALYSRDVGQREAKFSFDVGQGTQDLGFRGELDMLFACLSSQPITLRVFDEQNLPTIGAFVIRDKLGRVYPSQAKRLAPDLAFQQQIYRADKEVIKLPAGVYSVDFSRGPESVPQQRMLVVEDHPQTLGVVVRRWIDPSLFGWWSGDHHIHAAGCAHYSQPTEGVLPLDMIRQTRGEDLKIGCNLTWGPCFDFQKQFFCGKVDTVSQYPYLLRYDVEVSGFGSHQSGHLCLLRLRDQIYPGGDSDKHWPTLGLNTLRWAKKQGAICGPAHSGYGLAMPGDEIPNFNIPPFDGIGANEFIVDVTHQVPGPDGKLVPAVDFISLVDTPPVSELSMWYHTLNAGFRVRGAGETDFPCISSERVGMGRTYVKLEDKLDFDSWCDGLARGASYVSDGRSHLLDFKIENQGVGEIEGEVPLDLPGTILLTVRAAAFLPPQPDPQIKNLPRNEKPFWHLERARIGDTREVPLEIIVNGSPVLTTNIVADGHLRDLAFQIKIERSSWVAVRILPSSHTNPIWVPVGGKPFAPIRRDVEWCTQGVEKCWSQKERFIKAGEMDDAKKAYDHARATYANLLKTAE